jgi:MOSC domain-containing protein YiiM
MTENRPEYVVPKITALYVAKDKGEPMQYHSMVKAIAGVGLEGDGFLDRYAAGKGAFSNAKQEKVRHVTIISQDDIDFANIGLEVPFQPHDTRRNIVIEGLSAERLLGRRFEIGTVALEGTSICDPCKRPDLLSGKVGFMDVFQGERGELAGIRAAILSTGVLTVGNEIFYEL